MPDGPEDQDAVDPSPDPTPDAEPTAEPKPLPVFNVVDDLPEPSPQAQLINDDDLSWVDKPEETEAARERRRERREQHRKKARSKRRKRRALKIGGSLFATFLVLFGFWFWWTFGGLERMPAIEDHAGQNTPGTNILLVGANPSEPTSSKAAGRSWQRAFEASDMVMVLHLTRSNDEMYVISIPGDSVLPIPDENGGTPTPGKLSEAYARGGADLFVQTVESYTGTTMDRVAVLNMNGLREITDHVGGVIVDVPNSDCGLERGKTRFVGDDALRYAALYPCLSDHDLGRVTRQQSLLRGLMRTAVDNGSIANPFTLSSLLKSTAGHLTVEENFSYPSMFSTLFSMRGLRSTSTSFLTVPVAADPFPNSTDAVQLDYGPRYTEMMDALRRDRIADYLRLNTDVVVR